MANEGQYPKADGDITYGSELNVYNPEIITVGAYSNAIGDGLIKFSDAVWQTQLKRTTDSGSTWSATGWGGADYTASATGAYGISAKQDGSDTKYTTDSGATWTSATTDPANATILNCCHLFSSTVGVCCGDASSGVSIWYTTDGGVNWTQASTGPTVETMSVIMCSATVGYALDNANSNIWKTTDGGANWTDTTDNSNQNGLAALMFPISADKFLATMQKQISYDEYTNSTNTVLNLESWGHTIDGIGNILLNGNYYYMPIFEASATGGNIGLLGYYAIKTDFTESKTRVVCFARSNGMNTHWFDSNMGIPCMITVGNYLYINTTYQIVKVPIFP